MRTYGQFCALAKALDVIGDRWNLLIVRELLLRGPCRYTDLLAGLPGIATNLLADRLTDLTDAGVVVRQVVGPPTPATTFSLTTRGEALRPVVLELGRWGAPLLADFAGEAFRGEWLALPAGEFLSDHEPDQPPISVAVAAADERFAIEVDGGQVRIVPDWPRDPAATIRAAPDALVKLLTGRLEVDDASVAWEGDSASLKRILPA